MEKRSNAGIWTRVSTHNQQELSLDSQELAVRRILTANGYDVPDWAVLKVEWTSMDLLSCPEFQLLRRWVREGVIGAVGVLDRDRLQAQGLQRLIFLSECQEAGVPLLTVQGPALLEGGEGQLVELALALGKERSVLRAQQGARDGLRDRAQLKGLPPHLTNLYGMRWKNDRLVPNDDYAKASDVWRLALEGNTLTGIARELQRRGVPSPRGLAVWRPNTIRAMLHNRTYAGVIEALKTESIEPRHRGSTGYGRTSRRVRPPEERILLRGLVAQPIITEAQFELVQHNLQDNQKMAPRNTKRRKYLLQGLVRCGMCGRTYGGVVHRTHRGVGQYAYHYCRGRWAKPWEGEKCFARTFRAQDLEDGVYDLLSDFIKGPEGFMAEISRRRGLLEVSAESMSKELAELERQQRLEQDAETKAFRMYTRGRVSEDVYQQEIALIRTRRKWLAEQRERLKSQLADLERYSFQESDVDALRERIETRLSHANADDRRFVLEAVGTRVIVNHGGIWEVEIRVPKADTQTEELQIATTRPESNYTCNTGFWCS